MSHLYKVALRTAAILTLFTLTGHAQQARQSGPKIAGFLAAYGGVFSLSMPQVERGGKLYDFEDIYGSKVAFSYGGEAGIGLGDIGLFLVIKSRIWEINGKPLVFGSTTSVDIDVKWKEQFLYFGGRYCFVGQTTNSRAILPFVGAGFIKGEATESWSGTWDGDRYDFGATIDGTGYFLEGGAHFFLSPKIAVSASAEYSKMKFDVPDRGGLIRDAELNGGGGIPINIALSLFFGRAMKTF